MKMGYYPTPPEVVGRVRSFLRYPSAEVSVLDPCCGEGAALRDLTTGERARTYGIEPDDHRAKEAKQRVDHVLHCGCEDARISNDAFSCLFLNPPYDWQDTRAEGRTHERTEKVFLTGTAKYLMPEGVLVYIVPQRRVTSDVARVLSYRFGDFGTYRFPDGEYEQFRQVVLFGRKKGASTLDATSFDMIGGVPYTDLPEIPHLEEPVYDLPASAGVKVFRSLAVDEAELERELKASPLWGKLDGHGRGSRNGVRRPPLPLHTGHLGLLLASGCLDGVVGEGEDRHVVRGKVEKVTRTEQDYEGDVLVERELEAYRVSLKVLDRAGEIRNLM